VKFEWTKRPDEIRRGLAQLDRRTQLNLQAAFDYQAARSTAHMKTQAPWTDRTSAARNGLHAVANSGPGYFELVLSHAVSYGIWLEVANSGKYQIILPSLRAAMRELQGLIDGIWDRA
jgi:hypothetical protein